MSQERDTLLFRVGSFLSFGRHAAALARILCRPATTARSWTSGRRKMPAHVASILARRLRNHAAMANALAAEVEYYASVEHQRPRVGRGWQVVRERDGQGSVPRDGRWRGDRAKRP